MSSNEISKSRRMELILRQIESLPTLPVIATRLLALTASDDSQAREVIELVSADPALTSKVLSLCRSADKGIREEVVTVDKAVVLLGFNAIRNAVLSIKVFEMFDGKDQSKPSDNPEGLAAYGGFDHAGFWMHSLAVGVLAEGIVKETGAGTGLNADEAFVCGLLHDVGKLALEQVLPKSYERVVELAELNHGNIATYERSVVGIDHHTAGKRLAEQWGLPHRLGDCIWLHGGPYDSLPDLPHKKMVGLISLADILVRKQHLGYSGNYVFGEREERLIERLDLPAGAVQRAVDRLHDRLESRGKALGIYDKPSREMFMQSIQRANEALGRVNHVLEKKGQVAQQQGVVLEGVARFHSRSLPGRSVQDVIDQVIMSARETFGNGFYAMVYPGKSDEVGAQNWQVSRYTEGGDPVDTQCVDVPMGAPDLRSLDLSEPMGVNMMGVLPWVQDFLVGSQDIRKVRLLPLQSGWGTVAVLLHDRSNLANWQVLLPLVSTWGAAMAGAEQHDGARRLGEQLAEANSALADAQDRLLRQESMARLGEMASGAAHEMNNPLAVISGRSQLLSMTLQPGSNEQKTAQTIFKEAHRLSDLITALRLFAEPPRPELTESDLASLLDGAIKRVRSKCDFKDQETPIYLRVKQTLPKMRLDTELIQEAVGELLHNAIQSHPREGIEVIVDLTENEGAVNLQVKDDGEGMDEKTLEHAMDPFYSAKPAGRRVGMGLTRAKQYLEGHNGCLELASELGQGTVATVKLPLDSAA
ncbi:HDOD domain-containing protein [Poriferisphaera sp. WC338]|uniref:HDOD domain-containing protein n=1 Tax=Poriferisphaera sp. WC338 TaxID=3425129 RepID=UPI003D816E7F